ncbi:MAG: DNA gyrase subunit A [Myxococcota bacterium]|nr:DNA gyrase subunit A [Myxococcota bacterium]
MAENHEDQSTPPTPAGPRIRIEDEMRSSYLDYAMSVIVGRALPEVRDGLKPVHRRILYAMYKAGYLHNRKYNKSAKIVGEVLGKFHPHGDTAVYDALVRLAQPWNMRYPLVDGQGNFGSVDGDSAAAMRYTEARLTRLAERMLDDIEKDTVPFVDNYDGSEKEPTVLPTRIPALLLNGSDGIAVGMATKAPPHNLREVADAIIHLIQNPDASVDDLMRFVPGPDFPTAGLILGRGGARDFYHTGRGSIRMRGRAVIEKMEKGDRERIVITEIPFQVNKARMIERIAELVRDKEIAGVSDLRDESDREGMRVVVEVKRDAEAQVVLNQLYNRTPLQETFGANLVCISGGKPVRMNLKQVLEQFINHRREVVTRRSRFELAQAQAREHILEGLLRAVDLIDEIIALIRASESPAAAKTGLISSFGFSEAQAQAILDMRLARLTALERDKLMQELAEVRAAIAELREILSSERKLLEVITRELQAVRDEFGDDRRTEIIEDASDIRIEDLIAEEDVVVTVSHAGYVKRASLSTYRRQRRGGKGRTGMTTREEDFVETIFIANTHSYILVFTDQGKCYWLKTYEIPEASPQSRGKPVVNLIQIESGEKIAAILPVREFREGQYIIMATRNGTVKKTDLMAYSNPRASGIKAIKLEEGDSLIAARLTNGDNQIFLGSKQGISIRFDEKDVRPMGRDTTGVRGMEIEPGDEVIGMEVLDEGSTILAVSSRGYGKRTELEEYRLQSRGGKGIITMKTTDRIGTLVAALQAQDQDDIMIITTGGTLIRSSAAEISRIGRNAQGVRLINLEGDETVASVTRIREPEDSAAGEEPAAEAG